MSTKPQNLIVQTVLNNRFKKKHISTKSEDAEKSICKTVSRKDHDTEIRSVEDK